MDFVNLSTLLTACSNFPVVVLLLVVVLLFALCMYVLANKKACDNCVRVIAAIRGELPPKD